MASSERTIIVATSVSTNLRILEPSRKKLRPGDVFTMHMPHNLYLFGRVVSTDAVIGPMTDCILIYVYNVRADSKQPPAQQALTPANLLIPPLMINRLPWSRGYFETVANWPLGPADVLPQHCFWCPVYERYYDEQGNELSGPVEPVGSYTLSSYRTVDDEISDALGIARVPEDV